MKQAISCEKADLRTVFDKWHPLRRPVIFLLTYQSIEKQILYNIKSKTQTKISFKEVMDNQSIKSVNYLFYGNR